VVHSEFIACLSQLFSDNANETLGVKMSKYMKNKFPFYGIPSPVRLELSNKAINNAPISTYTELIDTVRLCFNLNEREWQYTGIFLLLKYKKLWMNNHMNPFFEELVLTKSWWDTVDTLSSNCIGLYLKKNPKAKDNVLEQWFYSNNMWLNRVVIIHQLTYKEDVDTDLLKQCAMHFSPSKEFFIQKAIGWALRQYAKYNPDWVLALVNSIELKPLSKREATKHLKLQIH